MQDGDGLTAAELAETVQGIAPSAIEYLEGKIIMILSVVRYVNDGFFVIMKVY